jgi:hypothetical protein
MLNNRQQRLEGFKPSKRYTLLKINLLVGIFWVDALTSTTYSNPKNLSHPKNPSSRKHENINKQMVLLIVCTLTFVIHFMGTMSYCLRIVNVQTHKSAITWSLFNFLMVGSRMAITLQAPLLAKYVENRIFNQESYDIAFFRYVIIASMLGAMLGGLAIPTGQRVFTQIVEVLYKLFSFPKLIRAGLRWKNWKIIQKHFAIPKQGNFQMLTQYQDISLKIMFLHMMSNAFFTVSVLSCLLAGYLNPTIRATAASLNGFVNGAAIVIFMVFADPDMAILSDRVIAGEQTQQYFRKYMVFVVVSRFIGTLLAQFMLLPLAYLIAFIAKNCIF